jgi:AraC family transcriptional regulator
MEVKIVNFPETKIAVIEHHGPPELEHESVKKLVSWRIANKLPPSDVHRSYGIHFNNPKQIAPSDYRVDLCVSVEHVVEENEFGVVNKVIPALRCGKARHYGSRNNVSAAQYLFEQWLPQSGEKCAKFPLFFHYLNVGPEIKEDDMVTDVYLPIL